MSAPASICETGAAVSASPSVRLDDAGLEISRVGFGCASLMRLASARQRQDLIAAVVDAGVTHFDVARMYGLGAAEAELGRALRARGGEVTIATKFGIDVSGKLRWLRPLQAPARAVLAKSTATRSAVRSQRERFVAPRVYDVAKARASLDMSLRKLAVDHVDILFLHDPRPQDEIDAAALAAFLGEARTAGKIRAWGMSIDDSSRAEVVSRLPGASVVQLRHDVLDDDTSPRPKSIAFGVLSAHDALSRWLSQSSETQQRWATAIGADPLQDDLLAKLLVAHTLTQPNVMACLYSTTQVRRLSVPAAVMRSSLPPGEVEGFARCLAAERSAIAGLAAR